KCGKIGASAAGGAGESRGFAAARRWRGERMQADIGLIGLAVMGQNLVLNMESKGYTVAVYNRTTSTTQAFVSERAAGKAVIPAYTLEEFVQALKRPRKVMLMVKAGAPVDAVIEQLLP